MEFQFKTSHIPTGKSFIVLQQPFEAYSVLHAHPDFEVSWIASGNGKRIVGNKISRYENEDLMLLGPNLPHSRDCDASSQNNPPECLTLFISEKLLKSGLLNFPELEPILNLFNRSLSGLVFKGAGVKDVTRQLNLLAELSGIDSFIALIQLLKTLIQVEVQEIISVTPDITVSHFKDLDQIRTVYDYVVHHIEERITLDHIAGLLNMAPGSFSRYFKKRTGTSFIQYVKEIRISQASKMLSDTEMPISQICLDSGYNNLANFNFYFKSVMKMTPSEYRKNFR